MPKGTPVTPGSTTLGDYLSGLYGCAGVLLALHYKEKTGCGRMVQLVRKLNELQFPLRDR